VRESCEVRTALQFLLKGDVHITCEEISGDSLSTFSSFLGFTPSLPHPSPSEESLWELEGNALGIGRADAMDGLGDLEGIVGREEIDSCVDGRIFEDLCRYLVQDPRCPFWGSFLYCEVCVFDSSILFSSLSGLRLCRLAS
jgi:hypothetical protein